MCHKRINTCHSAEACRLAPARDSADLLFPLRCQIPITGGTPAERRRDCVPFFLVSFSFPSWQTEGKREGKIIGSPHSA